MRKINTLCLSLVGLTGFILNANQYHDNDSLKSDAHEKKMMSSIEFVDLDEEIELGVELLQYLPEDFDPYKGMVIDPSEINFEEIGKPEGIDFETKSYLPKNFNPYLGQ
ncbi:hypothetical protein MTsPCn5_22760 [Croceitalea sp. MTPC5]|uniref:hypothetical protein n=1 Tax=Croceitalea sp. MTPC5 TaxID=3056565 RepID=UPI002B3CB69C|nr:hypothetical protein MTsPCn5_22760 [Croceitalea sp. MTPC5]